MKQLLYILLLLPIICNAQGFNLGQQHFRANQIGFSNGYIPKDSVIKWKAATPINLRSWGRKSGTMSNTWNLDSTGYNHNLHKSALRKNEPTQSYFHAYTQWLKDWQYDSMVYTLNTHWCYLQTDVRLRNHYIEQMFAMLDSVTAITKVNYICLENESYLDPRIIGMSAGTPTAADKRKYKGGAGLFTPNARFEGDVKNQYRDFMNFLIPIVARLRSEYPGAKLAISCDHPITLRGRWMLDVVKEYRSLWDVIDVHLYPNTSNRSATLKWVNDRLIGFGSLPIVIFEWNYHFDSGVPYNGFYNDMEGLLKPYPNLRHTLWYSGSGFSYIK